MADVQRLDALAAAGDNPRTPLAPRALAKLLRSGRGKPPGLRTIQDWFAAGCPHETIEGKHGKTRVALIDDVLSFVRRRGLDYRLADSVHEAARGNDASDDSADDADDKHQPTLLGPGGELDRRVEERLKELLAHEPPLRQRIIQYRAKLDGVLRTPASQIVDATEARTHSAAMKNCSSELRLLEQLELEYREKRGDLVPRDVVHRVIDEISTLYTSTMESLPGETAEAVKNAIAKAGTTDLVALQRVSVAATMTVVEQARLKLAELIAGEVTRYRERASEKAAAGEAELGDVMTSPTTQGRDSDGEDA